MIIDYPPYPPFSFPAALEALALALLCAAVILVIDRCMKGPRNGRN